MNIDYGQILKNASARHTALENLALELNEIDALWLHLTASEAHLEAIVERYKAVDAEGIKLLPTNLNSQLSYTTLFLQRLRQVMLGDLHNIASLINEVNKFKES